MVYLDMGFLPYLGLPDDYHFGAHCIAVVGYDADRETVLAADRDDVFHEVSLDTLEQARSSTFKPFPPKHKWYEFDFSAAHAPTESGVRDSLRDVTELMLQPPISNFGVKGIRKAAQQTRMWPNVLDEEALRRTCFNTSIFIDPTGGTGGGIFRYMYARFLTEAAALTGEDRLDKVAKELHRIGDSWEDVAAAFRAASEADDPAAELEQVVAPMPSIADAEQAVWEELSTLAG